MSKADSYFSIAVLLELTLVDKTREYKVNSSLSMLLKFHFQSPAPVVVLVMVFMAISCKSDDNLPLALTTKFSFETVTDHALVTLSPDGNAITIVENGSLTILEPFRYGFRTNVLLDQPVSDISYSVDGNFIGLQTSRGITLLSREELMLVSDIAVDSQRMHQVCLLRVLSPQNVIAALMVLDFQNTNGKRTNRLHSKEVEFRNLISDSLMSEIHDSDGIVSVAVDQDLSTAVTLSNDDISVKVWDVSTGKLRICWSSYFSLILRIYVSDKGLFCAYENIEGNIVIRHTYTGSELIQFNRPGIPFYRICSNDSLACAVTNSGISIRRRNTGHHVDNIQIGPQHRVTSYSPTKTLWIIRKSRREYLLGEIDGSTFVR